MRGHFVRTQNIESGTLIEIRRSGYSCMRSRNWYALNVTCKDARFMNVQRTGIHGFGGRWYRQTGQSATGHEAYGKIHIFDPSARHRVICHVPISNRYALRKRT